jgi:hypothetical protein
VIDDELKRRRAKQTDIASAKILTGTYEIQTTSFAAGLIF